MFLEKLHLVNFKNYKEAEILLDAGINCFVGNNGEGKTNILDAVYYLSICKSYMNPVDKQNIRFDQPFFVIQGTFRNNGKTDEIHCAVKIGHKKSFRKNKKEYEKLGDHIGNYPAVIISPYDRNLISEGSEMRRRWMDSIIAQFDKQYLNLLQTYVKVLAQRNALLKNMAEQRLFDRESIEIWDLKLVETGEKIFQKRKRFLNEFIPVFQKHYNEIGDKEERVHLSYKSHLLENDFKTLLSKSEKKDIQTRYTNVGIHRDDLVFEIKGLPVKKFGSQGQQKSFLIALKLAQYEWLKNHLKTTPILLLDDIFDKLDHQRVEKLMQLVSKQFFGQVLLTDTDIDRVNKIFSNNNFNYHLFEVKNGEIKKLNDEEKR